MFMMSLTCTCSSVDRAREWLHAAFTWDGNCCRRHTRPPVTETCCAPAASTSAKYFFPPRRKICDTAILASSNIHVSTGAIKVMGECCATYVLLLVRSQRLSFQFLSRRRRSRSITFCKNAWIAVDWVRPKCECRVQVIKVAGLVWSGPATTEQLMVALHFKLQSGLCWAAVGRTHSKNLLMAEWVRSFLSQSSREIEGLRGSSVGQERSVTPQADETLKQACYSLAVENWSFNIFHTCTHMD